MGKFLITVLLSVFATLLYGQAKSGYEIEITLDGLPDSTVFLAYHLGDKQYIKDTLKLDRSGHGIFRGKEALPQGLYMIVFPGRKYFEVLMSADQYFSVRCNYYDYINTLKFSGSDENTAFVNYQKSWMSMQQKDADIGRRIQNNRQNSDSVKILTADQKAYEAMMISFLRSVIGENDGNLLSVLVKAMLPPEPPRFTFPVGASNPDSLMWVMNYNYNKDHYFDNIDLTDERLLRTPILYARINAFFTNVIIQAPDSVNKEIDRIIKKCSKNYKIYQFVAVYLFNHFRESEIMGHDAVMVKLADDIYLSGKADWVSKEFRDDLRRQIELIPKLKAYYEKARNNGIEVFAICTQSDKQKWSRYIEENKLTWINGWDPKRSSHFDSYYNVQSTPMVYILDKNKVIIAKKLSVEDIGPFIDNYRKMVR
jgi:hypothetical protein